MEPLNDYEIQELLMAMGQGDAGIPIGSIWSKHDIPQMFIVLHHANMPMNDGPQACLVLQSLPNGQAWVQLLDAFMSGDWVNVGFVWDRGIVQ
jgi:hypothetical protein